MISKQDEEEIYKEVEKCVEEIKGMPFDKGLPVFQKSVWDIGDKHGIKGDEVVRIYFDSLKKK